MYIYYLGCLSVCQICGDILLLEGPEGVNGNWGLPIFGLEKWDLGYWDWE
jgi:hypothetical protein